MADAPSFETLSGGTRIFVSRDHKFGTDAFLLARFAAPKPADRVCDLGSGCGIIPLIWLDRNPRLPSVHALELQSQGVELMELSRKENGLENRFFPYEGDLRRLEDLKTQLPAAGFSLVTCNPPYKAAGSGVPCPGQARLTARHEVSCTLEEVCRAAARLLRFGGRFCLCHRPERLTDVLCALRQAGLEPKRLRLVQQREGAAPWLLLAEGRKGSKPFLRVEPPLTVENPGGGFSREMQEIYGLVPEASSPLFSPADTAKESE